MTAYENEAALLQANAALAAERDALRAENQRLRGLLAKAAYLLNRLGEYPVEHDTGCPWRMTGRDTCKCGLHELILDRDNLGDEIDAALAAPKPGGAGGE